MDGRDVSRRRKKGAEEGKTSVFVDEAGVQLLPAVVRTYAPVGETPVMVEQATHEHLSVISAVTAAGKLFTRVQEEAFRGEQVVAFLEQLQRLLGGRLLIYWDRSRIHRGDAVKAWLAARHAGEVRIEPLPAYAPELNPDEYLNNDLKGSVNASGLPHSKQEQRSRIQEFMRHLLHLPEHVISYFQHPCVQYASAIEL